jgi:adenylate cyclase
MNARIAEELISQLKSSQHHGLVDNLIHSAIRYARIRVDWMLLPPEQRMGLEETKKKLMILRVGCI